MRSVIAETIEIVKERALTPLEEAWIDDLVIGDDSGPVAIAGVMGGLATGVTTSTRRILLETAVFDPAFVRRTSRRLGLSSDSSYRFERGVAPNKM